jgi:hypothetical protein
MEGGLILVIAIIYSLSKGKGASERRSCWLNVVFFYVDFGRMIVENLIWSKKLIYL